MNRVALVEDQQRLSALLVKALLNAGIETDTFDQMEPASLAAGNNAYAVLVIDRGLPDGDGLDLVRRLRGGGLGSRRRRHSERSRRRNAPAEEKAGCDQLRLADRKRARVWLCASFPPAGYIAWLGSCCAPMSQR
jgi:hypothetical protein